MRTRNQFATGGVLLLLVIAIVQLRFDSELGQTPKGHGDGRTRDRIAKEKVDESGSTPKAGQRNRRSVATIESLQELGYVINANRIGRTSAEGSVEIRAPDGTTITGDELQVAASGDAFFLSGGVRIRQDSGWMATEDENAFVKISTKSGRFSASKARWEINVRAPFNKAQK